MFLVLNIDQMYKEMKKIVEVGNKHGNGDGFCRSIFFLGIKNVRVGSKILGSIGNTYIIFFWPNMSKYFLDYIHMWHNAIVGLPPLVDTHINLFCKFNIY